MRNLLAAVALLVGFSADPLIRRDLTCAPGRAGDPCRQVVSAQVSQEHWRQIHDEIWRDPGIAAWLTDPLPALDVLPFEPWEPEAWTHVGHRGPPIATTSGRYDACVWGSSRRSCRDMPSGSLAVSWDYADRHPVFQRYVLWHELLHAWFRRDGGASPCHESACNEITTYTRTLDLLHSHPAAAAWTLRGDLSATLATHPLDLRWSTDPLGQLERLSHDRVLAYLAQLTPEQAAGLLGWLQDQARSDATRVFLDRVLDDAAGGGGRGAP